MLQQYKNRELPYVQAGFRKGKEINIHWIIEKARVFQRNIYFGFIDYTKAFDCVDHNKLWKILKEMASAYKLNKQVTIYSLDVLLSQFGTSLLFHV